MITKTFLAEPQSLKEIFLLVEEQVSLNDHPSLRLVLEEVVMNVIHHAYRKGEKGNLIFSIQAEQPVQLWITDHGIPFDPTQHVPSSQAETIGGKGLLLVKNQIASWDYSRKGTTNTLHLILKETYP